MKVLMISHEFPPYIGGAGVVGETIALGLSEKRIKVDVLTGKPVIHKKYKNFTIKTVKFKKKIWPYYYYKALKNLNLSSYDNIILNDMPAVILASLFLKKRHRKKTLIYLHGGESDYFFNNKGHYKGIFKYLRSIYKHLFKDVYKIICISKYVKNKFLEDSNWKEFEGKMEVIYVGIDSKLFYPMGKKIKNDKKILLSVGRVVEKKGYDLKYQLFKEILEKDENFHWIIVGKGNYVDDIIKKSKIDNIQSKITIINGVNREELQKIYSSSDLFWLLTKYNEGLGLVYLEAIFCGTPVLGPNKAGVIEAIENNETGYLVDSLDEVKEIILNKKYEKIKIDQNKVKIKFERCNGIKKLIEIMERTKYE